MLIACEGKTERAYFDGIRRDLRLPTGRVRILESPGTDPLSVVTAALEARQDAERDRGWVPSTDQAWAVFDVDDDLRDNPSAWNTAIQRSEGRVRLAISNPAFELWCVLHFQDQEGAVGREHVKSALRNHWPDYRKGAAAFDILKPILQFDAQNNWL